MENLDDEPERLSGILNLQGATIYNLVINGSMARNGSECYYRDNSPTNSKTVTPEELAAATEKCKPFMWGPSSLATIFCVCRDIYDWPNNASHFERTMSDLNIDCPRGTISNTIRHNKYMKMPIERWRELRASPRVIKLADEFQKAIDDSMKE